MQEKPRYEAVKAVIFNNEGKVLVTWKKEPRLFRSTEPITHDLPGGKVEPHDKNAESAAAREVVEETGLHVHVIPGHVNAWKFEREKDVLDVKTFAAVHLSGTPELSSELAKSEWRDPSKLDDAPAWLREDVKKALAVHQKMIAAYLEKFKKR